MHGRAALQDDLFGAVYACRLVHAWSQTPRASHVRVINQIQLGMMRVQALLCYDYDVING